MKCPQCGNETGPGKACERCGEELPPRKEVEVEYKEFSVSELLDIKMVKKARAAQTGEKGGPLPRRGAKQVKASRTEETSGKKTSFIVIMTVIIVVLAAITGLYLFKYLPGF
jgi:hypothetical protein